MPKNIYALDKVMQSSSSPDERRPTDLILVDNNTFVDHVCLELVKAGKVATIDHVYNISNSKHLFKLYISSFLRRLKVSGWNDLLMHYSDTLFALLKISILVIFNKKRGILDIKLRNQKVGDALVSTFLRSRKSIGIYVVNIMLYYSLLKQVIYLHCACELSEYLRLNCLKINKNLAFLVTETTYLQEACRRLFISQGIDEVRWNPLLKKFSIFHGFNGIQISKFDHISKSLSSYLLDNTYSDKGHILLDKLVRREWTYAYMTKSDINPDEKIVFSFEHTGAYAVIFMHAVSDAQYLFGDNDFLDLHDWLIKTIKLCIEYNITCVLKLHPSYFSEDHNYESDKRYLQIIQKLLSFDISDFSSNKSVQILKTSHKYTYCSSQISSNQLADSLGTFIGITHHGSIAFELAYQGLPCICSSLSYYSILKSLPPQIKTYSNLEEYRSIIQKLLDAPDHNNLNFYHSSWRGLFSLLLSLY